MPKAAALSKQYVRLNQFASKANIHLIQPCKGRVRQLRTQALRSCIAQAAVFAMPSEPALAKQLPEVVL
jgi:hypothetical protein